MTDDDAEILQIYVDVAAGELTVMLPNTSYTVTYFVESNLVVGKPFSWEEDSRASMTRSDFLNSAHRIATMRARELGWIV